MSSNQVLRYVGELKDSELTVSLKNVTIESPLGRLKGSDSLFEIYTERYGEKPLVIQGAGAGAEVTASGVFSDVLKIGKYVENKS